MHTYVVWHGLNLKTAAAVSAYSADYCWTLRPVGSCWRLVWHAVGYNDTEWKNKGFEQSYKPFGETFTY